MRTATEIVTMKMVEGMNREDFIGLVDALEKDYHAKQPGFMDTELLYNDKTDEWIMIQHWDSLENMRAASKNMFNNPVTEAFVKALDPKSVKMIMLPQVRVWG